MRTLSIALLCLTACGRAPDIEEPRRGKLMMAVLQHGAKALPEPAPEPVVVDENGLEVRTYHYPPRAPDHPFATFDDAVREFLVAPGLRPGVQFTCSGGDGAVEEWVEAGLDAVDPIVRLRALVVLVRVRAPRSVAKQWGALQGLLEHPVARQFGPVLAELQRAFSPPALDEALTRVGSRWRLAAGAPTLWAVRAAGASGHQLAVSQLTKLATSSALQPGLCAQRSLADLAALPGGAAAVDGLEQCVLAWRYDASLRAARSLMRHAPERLRSILLGKVPARFRRYQGLMLADLEDARAVPFLCESVGGTAIVEGKMFDAIERLALREHRDVVLAMRGEVRARQRPRADQIVATLSERFGW